MKMKTEHYKNIKRKIQALGSNEKLLEVLQRYLERDKSIPRIEQAKNLNMRFRWDILHHVFHNDFDFITKTLYSYLHDDHIDTALKAIIKEILPETTT